MRCPFCSSDETQVKDSRPAEDNTVIRRRRTCPVCAARFTTFERVQLRELIVVKKSQRKVPFDREKLRASVNLAIRKRSIDADLIERAISGIIRQLESSGDNEIQSEDIGRLVMEALKNIDHIAYIRFASVYRNFSHAKDFHTIIDEITDEPAHPTKPIVKTGL